MHSQIAPVDLFEMVFFFRPVNFVFVGFFLGIDFAMIFSSAPSPNKVFVFFTWINQGTKLIRVTNDNSSIQLYVR